MVWRTRLFGVPPDSVRCTRTIQGPTSHSQVSAGALRYNSPDCLVYHRTVQWTSGQWLSSAQQSTLTMNSATQYRDRSQISKLEGHQTVRWRKRTKLQRSTSLRTLTVGWRGGAPDIKQWVSGGAPDCPVRPSPAASPTTYLVVEGYKYPQLPQIQASKISEHHIQYKSSSIHS
jgi:hypothetical protein